MGRYIYSYRSIVGRGAKVFCACFFAVLVMAFFILPAKEISAAGAGKPYPAEAFNGKWDAAEKLDSAVATLTAELHSDGTIYYAFYSYTPGDGVFKNGLEGTVEYYGTYTYDEKTGELSVTASSESLSIAMGTMTEKAIWTLKDIDTLQIQDIEFNGNPISPAPNIYYRLSATPVYDQEEEDDAAKEESAEEASVPEEEIEEEETEEDVEEEESEEDVSDDASEAASDEAAEAAEAPEQLLTDEQAERLLVSIFEGDDEHLDLAKTAAATVGMTLGGFVSALLAAGTLGGSPPPPTAGAEGAVPTAPGPGRVGPGVKIDSDGDIHFTSPVNGKESVYVSNGDGTYRNVLTDVEVTLQDINDMADYQFENSGQLQLEQEKHDAWMDEQRQANSFLSKEAKQAALDKKKLEKELAEQDRKNKIMYSRGVFDGNEKEFKKAILKERQVESEKFGKYAAAGEYWDAATKSAENVKAGADLAIDVMAEIEPTGTGKTIKNGYKFLSEAAGQSGEVMAGKQSLKQAIGKTLVNGACEYVKDNVDMTELKCMANITGNGTAAYVNARIDGKTHEQALGEASQAAKDGAVDFAVDYTVGKIADGVTDGVEVKDNKVYNGLYNNRGVTGDSVSKLGKQMHTSGFTKAPVTNDNFKNGISTLVSDLVKESLSGDDE